MGRGSLGLVSTATLTVYDRPALKRKEHHGLGAVSAAGLCVGEGGQLREHGAIVVFVRG